MWKPVQNHETIGQVGSENGIIIADEEYKDNCRITLEKEGYTPYGITCGIYGLMVHTVFASEKTEAEQKYEAMKKELQEFVDSSNDEDDDWCEQFVTRW